MATMATQSQRDTALHVACSSSGRGRRNFRMIRLLLQAGAAVDVANADGWTPLHLVCQQYSSLDVVYTMVREYNGMAVLPSSGGLSVGEG